MNCPPELTADSAHRAKTPAELVFSLLHASRVLSTRLEGSLAAVGSSLAKHGVLTLLVDAGEPLALSELAAHQNCVRSNITQLVDRLEADGLVERVADPSDRRSVHAVLTPEGRERQAAGAAEIDAIAVSFSGALSSDDRAALERVVRVLE